MCPEATFDFSVLPVPHTSAQPARKLCWGERLALGRSSSSVNDREAKRGSQQDSSCLYLRRDILAAA